MSNNNITQPPSDLVKISIVPSDDMSSCFRMPYKLAAGGQDHSITTSVINSIMNEISLTGGGPAGYDDEESTSAAGRKKSGFSGLAPASLAAGFSELDTQDINDIIDQIPTQALAGGFSTISEVPTELLLGSDLDTESLTGGDLETSFGDLYSDADSFDMDLESTDSDLFSLYENGLSGGDNSEVDLSSSMISELESLYPGI